MTAKTIYKSGDLIKNIEIINEIEKIDKNRFFLCKCFCGEEFKCKLNLLKSKAKTQISCGCLLGIKAGDIINKFTVIERANKDKSPTKFKSFICKCECGEIETVEFCDLKSEKRKACKKCSNQSIFKPGDKFWRLTLISEAGRDKNGRRICNFKCDCGEIITGHPNNVKYGDSKSCGCLNIDATAAFVKMQRIEIEKKVQIGFKFSKLLVIAEAGLDNKENRLVMCLCDCGKNIIIRSYYLMNSRPTKSCGCNKGTGQITYEPWMLEYTRQISHNNSTRKLEFTLTLDECTKLLQGDCYYCGSKPKIKLKSKLSSEFRNGIDRIDSFKGYNIENCRSCCFNCNNFKSDLDCNVFLSKIKNIYENLNFKNNLEINIKNNLDKPITDDNFDPKDPYYRAYNIYIRRNNYDRKLEFELTKEEFKLFISGNCYYCNVVPSRYAKEVKIYRNGIDRIDNKIGYIFENSCSCCFECNTIKSTRMVESFISTIRSIYEYLNMDIWNNVV